MNLSRKTLWYALAAMVGIGVLSRLLATPSTIPEDFSPVEIALGVQIGTWLGPETQTVLMVDTDWPAAHLRKLAAGRLAGIKQALPTAEIEVVEANGYNDQAAAWARALSQLSNSTSVVACFGIPSAHDLPTSYRKLVVVGNHEGKGLPKGVDRLPECLLIKARPSQLAPVGRASWQGTSAERFAAAYEIIPPAPTRKKP